VLVERDLAHGATLGTQLAATARNTLIHPVVLPVLAGMAWNLTGFGLHPVADEVLTLLGSGVVPLCLVLIGVSLAYYGAAGRMRVAFGFSLIKLVVAPALVLAFAHGVLGISGLPLAVMVVMAALPIGSNPLIFAQRYGVLVGEVTAATVVSTAAFVVVLPLWLVVLARVG
jgi:predicted permease